MQSSHETLPCFTFGVIADVQYANVDDGYNYTHSAKRYYRGALDKLKGAISFWNNKARYKPDVFLQLGDALDGKNKGAKISESSLKTVLEVFAQIEKPIYHVLGNHDYYNFSKEYLRSSKLFSGNELHCEEVPKKVYYTAQPHPGLKLIALDCYEISMIGSPKGSPEYIEALDYLATNPNEEKNSPAGLSDDQLMLVAYNGALTNDQLKWLEQHLQESERAKQNVIVMGHCAVYGPSSHPTCLCWNHPAVMELLHRYRRSVVCYFAGHDHAGGMAYDKDEILHMTLPGVLENNKEADFGTVYVYRDRMEIEGQGRVHSLTVPLRYNLEQESVDILHKDVPDRELKKV